MEQKKVKGIEELRSKMNLAELHISRFPRHSKTFVIDYANHYFEGDYGMCLNHIVNTFRGMTPIGYEELQAEIDELRGTVELLKQHLDKPKEDKKLRTMQQRIDAKKEGIENGKV